MICCICNTEKHSELYKVVDDYRLLKCKDCGIVYLDDKSDPKSFINDAKDDLKKENKNIEYWSFPDIYSKYSFVFHKYFQERLSRLLQFNPAIKSIFDIGSGYGFWLYYCKQKGYNVKGIDISDEAVKYAQKTLKLDVHLSTLSEFNFSNNYDVYTLCDVLEHVEKPSQELKKIYNVMNINSLLYVQVPNVLGFRIPYKHNLGLPHHLWQFNSETLNALLKKNGFKILREYYGIQGVIGCHANNKVNLLTKLKWLIARKFNLGNRLMVLCMKA